MATAESEVLSQRHRDVLAAVLRYDASAQALKALEGGKLAAMAHAYSDVERAIRGLKRAEADALVGTLEPVAMMLAASRTQFDLQIAPARVAHTDVARGLLHEAHVTADDIEALLEQVADTCTVEQFHAIQRVQEYVAEVELRDRLVREGHYD